MHGRSSHFVRSTEALQRTCQEIRFGLALFNPVFNDCPRVSFLSFEEGAQICVAPLLRLLRHLVDALALFVEGDQLFWMKGNN